MGFVTLLYQPAVVFILLILLSLFIMRPFRIREWLIGLVGVTTPYYFLAIILYLGGHWNWRLLFPSISFRLPILPSSLIVTLGIAVLVVPFIIGGFYVQNNLNKMLIQVRKNWSLLLLFLIISLVIILINGNNNYVNWVLCAIPISAFHAAAYFFPNGKWVPSLLHWAVFIYALYIGYFA
jgi:hypothetical protein